MTVKELKRLLESIPEERQGSRVILHIDEFGNRAGASVDGVLFGASYDNDEACIVLYGEGTS